MNAELTAIFFVLFAYHLLRLLSEEEPHSGRSTRH